MKKNLFKIETYKHLNNKNYEYDNLNVFRA